MSYLILALAALLLAMMGLRLFMHTGPAALARALRIAGGTATAGLAFVSLARGQYLLAVALAMAALELITNMGLIGRISGRKSAGQVSRVATARIEIELDHDSGAIKGRVLEGAFKSRPLESLSRDELLALLAECTPADPHSAALIEAYLDRVAPGWRDAAASAASSTAAPRAGEGMTRAEAFKILGLEPGVSDEQIRNAWRDLMKRNHPDQGGSAEIAALINEAKETLLRE